MKTMSTWQGVKLRSQTSRLVVGVCLCLSAFSQSLAQGSGGYNVTNELVALFISPYYDELPLGYNSLIFIHRSFDREVIEAALIQSALWVIERHPDAGPKYANRLLLDNRRVLGEAFLKWSPDCPPLQEVTGILDDPWVREAAEDLAAIIEATRKWEPEDEVGRFCKWWILNRTPESISESTRPERTPENFSLKDILPKIKIYRADIGDGLELMVFAAFERTDDLFPNLIHVWRARKEPRERVGSGRIYHFTMGQYVAVQRSQIPPPDVTPELDHEVKADPPPPQPDKEPDKPDNDLVE